MDDLDVVALTLRVVHSRRGDHSLTPDVFSNHSFHTFSCHIAAEMRDSQRLSSDQPRTIMQLLTDRTILGDVLTLLT